MASPEPSKSPIPPGTVASGANRLDSLQKEDLIKFAKKQVAHLAETKKNQSKLLEKLKEKKAEIEVLKQNVSQLEQMNKNLTQKEAKYTEISTTQCSECLSKSEKLNLIEKQLLEFKNKAKNVDIVSLELRDLESKIDNLNRALREKTEALVKAHNVINDNDVTILQLRTSENQLKVNCKKLTEENTIFSSALKEEILKRSDLENQLKSAECRISELGDQQGNEKLNLAKIVAEVENRSRLLEEAIDVLKTENQKLKAEKEESAFKLEQIEKEYGEFKNKARFVLEKKGKQDEENRELFDDLEKSKEKINELENEIDVLKNTNSKTIDEMVTNKDKVEKLKNELESKKMAINDAEKNHILAINDLRTNLTKRIQRLEEDLRITRASRDNFEQTSRELTSGKERLEHLLQTERQRGELENESLKNKLELATKQIKTLERELQELKLESEAKRNTQIDHQKNQKAIAAVVPQAHNIEHQNFGNLHRPLHANLSDSISCYEETVQHERSLEDVLYGELDDGYRLESMELTEEKFNHLKEELENMKKTNNHVSELLNEAENANGRLVSQNTLLKEEIRRIERQKEREKELSNEKNVEYLKNVIIQFLKPQAVPAEKEQLIAVLQRVLHLSPTEVDVLKAAAAQMATAQDNSSWTSYFSWTGSTS